MALSFGCAVSRCMKMRIQGHDSFQAANNLHWRQAAEHSPSVLFRGQAAVENGDYTSVFVCTNQSAHALLQPHRGVRQGEVVKPARFGSRLENVASGFMNRIVGNLERQAIDDDAAQFVAVYRNALPKTRCAEEHRIRCVEKPFDQTFSRHIALALAWKCKALVQHIKGAVQGCFAREENECAPFAYR